MGASWQTAEQKMFILEHTPSYVQHIANKTKVIFWIDFLKKWFKAWPLGEPTAKQIRKSRKLKNRQSLPALCRTEKINVSTVYLLTSRLELTIHTATEACLQSD